MNVLHCKYMLLTHRIDGYIGDYFVLASSSLIT